MGPAAALVLIWLMLLSWGVANLRDRVEKLEAKAETAAPKEKQ
jgi:hypothetical protein